MEDLPRRVDMTVGARADIFWSLHNVGPNIQHCAASQGGISERSRDVVNGGVAVETTYPKF